MKAVWDALFAYCYLPRLRDQAVFVEAVQDGIGSADYFGYATSVSAEGRYEGLKLGTTAAAIYVDGSSVLVKLDAAQRQIEAERQEPPVPGPGPGPGPGPSPDPPPPGPRGSEPSRLPRRFFGTVEINPDRAGRDMGQVAEEILQHLTTLPGGNVTVTVDIHAEVAEGMSQDVQRVVDENCRTLRFKSHGFEEK